MILFTYKRCYQRHQKLYHLILLSTKKPPSRELDKYKLFWKGVRLQASNPLLMSSHAQFAINASVKEMHD